MVGRPQYLDGLEKPYAVFRFKYRSVGVLKGLFGECVEEDVEEDGGRDKEEEEKVEKLRQKEKEELIVKMMELERRLELQDKSGEGVANGRANRDHGREKGVDKERKMSKETDGVARSFTEQWVQRHSRDPSVMAKSLDKEKSKRREKDVRRDKHKAKEAGGTWGQNVDVDVDDGWRGGDAKW